MLYAFDLLELDGVPLVDLPLTERKRRLRTLLDAGNRAVRLSDDFDDGEALLAAAGEQGLEGVVAKRASSRYASGRRTRDWLKIKLHHEQEFVIAGYTRGTGHRADTFGALVLGENEGGRLRYVGNVGTGFGDAEIGQAAGAAEAAPPRRRRRSPSRRNCPGRVPQTCSGSSRGWSRRSGSASGPTTATSATRAISACATTRPREGREVTGDEPIASVVRRGKRELRLSNLDKPFWPEAGITKGDLLRYYRAVAPVLVPHLKDRPFTMRRYPDGAFGKVFFQKNAPTHMPDWIPTFHTLVTTRDKAPDRNSGSTCRWCNDELALLWMVNMGCIDMNTWYSRDRQARPPRLRPLRPRPDARHAVGRTRSRSR